MPLKADIRATQRALLEFSQSFEGQSAGPLASANRGSGAGRRTFVRAGEGSYLSCRASLIPAPTSAPRASETSRTSAYDTVGT